MANLDALFGVMLIGVIVCSSLLGILTIQVYTYYIRFKNDPLWMKCWIATAYLIDVSHQIFGSWMSYNYAINVYSCPRCLEKIHWSVGAIALLEPLSAALTQLWFARRLYQFDRHGTWLVVMTAAVSLISMAAGLGSAIIIFTLKQFTQFGGHDTWHVTIWFAGGFVCDVLVTVPIAWSLYNTRTGFRSTNRLMTRLAVWIINTGALTATFALFVTILFLCLPHTLIYVSLNLVLASIYSNSLLAFLNRRGRWEQGLRSAQDIHWTTDICLSRLHPPRSYLPGSPPPAFTHNSGAAHLDNFLSCGDARQIAEDEFWGRDQ